jgi:biofilm PGA synthesis N-glycosyltransferase PgaC
MNYVLITPAKNEGAFIQHTLESIAQQTLLPLEWIIVDDGSTDNTAELVEQFSLTHPWVRLVRRETGSEVRSGGGKVVRAFLQGYAALKTASYDFLVKLDADLTLPQDYFEKVAQCFAADSRVGLCGGTVLNVVDGALIPEKTAPHHVRGAFKAYRRECYEQIGGLKTVWSWDGMDQMELMFYGWETRVLPLEVIHHRPTTSAYKIIPHRRETGREFYRNGYLIDLALVKTAEYTLKKPQITGGFAFLQGYLAAWAGREKKNVSPDLARWMRRFQYRRLMGFVFPSFRSRAK